MAKTHIVVAGVIVNTVLATPSQAAAACPSAVAVDADAHPGAIGDGWNGEVVIPAPAPPPSIPEAVTMRQARLALLAAGKLSAVQTAINSMSEPAKTQAQISWDYSSEVQRHNGFVSQLASALGLNDSDIDTLFSLAATL